MIKLFNTYVSEEAIQSVVRVLNSGWIGKGSKTDEFERSFAKYVGAKYAVATNSATAALHLATIVSDIQEYDEVLTTPITFVSTNHVLQYVKADPVFIDVQENTLNLDLDKIENSITKKTKAIMVIHYGGNPVDINRLYSIAKEHNLKVIEDAAHACGASFRGKKVGSFEGLTCFSFHAVKNLPIGDGGMITTNSRETYVRLQELIWLGISKSTYARSYKEGYKWEYGVDSIGYKYHMNDISASIGIEHLKHLDKWNDRRQEIVDTYKRNLPEVKFLEYTPEAKSSNHFCVIRVKNRDEFYKRLSENGIEAGVHYKPNYYYWMYKSPLLPVTEKVYREIISLPIHIKLTDEQIEYICSVIRRYYSLIL